MDTIGVMIGNGGDRSVGIEPEYYEISNLPVPEEIDTDREEFRVALQVAFELIMDSPIVAFTDELKPEPEWGVTDEV